jgi:hypothetical protein
MGDRKKIGEEGDTRMEKRKVKEWEEVQRRYDMQEKEAEGREESSRRGQKEKRGIDQGREEDRKKKRGEKSRVGGESSTFNQGGAMGPLIVRFTGPEPLEPDLHPLPGEGAHGVVRCRWS